MTLPTAYDGGGDTMEHALGVIEELGAGSASLGVSLITILQSSKIIEDITADRALGIELDKYR